ncbi:NRDE-2, necessary for RNA interference-domain-containing protein [Gongronella butleri]|nr:NRDE-2, necessary for RNA interference-domain-containing protein [Gongronella butleri]
MADHAKKHPGIPPPPSFSSAPSTSDVNMAPSFSSAPDLAALQDSDDGRSPERHRKKKKKDKKKKKARSRSRSRSPVGRRHHTRSRSPPAKNRARSRSPSHKKRARSRSPSDRYHTRSRSPSDRQYTRTRSRDRRPSAEKKRRHRRSSPSPYDRDRHSRRRRSRSRSRSPRREHEYFEERIEGFVMDRHGDADNVRYGINRHEVPAYSRFGRGFVVGLDRTVSLGARTEKNEIELIPSTMRKKRPTERPLALPTATRLIRSEADSDDAFLHQQGEIDIDSDHEDDEKDEWLSSGLDYRTVHSKIKPDAANTDAPRQQTMDEYMDNATRKQLSEFNRKLADNPANIEIWLAFASFQERIALSMYGGDTRRDEHTRASIADVKISVYEKALGHNPHSDRLWTEYLRCGAEVWSSVQLLNHWDTALRRCPNALSMWTEYINLRQTDFASYNYQDCCRVFDDCIANLRDAAHELRQGPDAAQNPELASIESVMVYILVRYVLFMKQAGYKEHAYALYQAMFEFNFYRPLLYAQVGTTTFADMVRDFAEFWDNEVPRFGEPGAEGWAAYALKKSNNESVEIMAPRKNIVFNGKPPMLNLQDWLQQERLQEDTNVMPSRMDDEEDLSISDDPFRMVVSDDLKRSLFTVTTDAARLSLMYGLFTLLGLPFAPLGIGTNTFFNTDTFTRNDMRVDGFWPAKQPARNVLTYVDGIAMSEIHQNDQDPFSMPLSYPLEAEELFAKRHQWFSCFHGPALLNEQDHAFATNAFERLIELDKDDTHLRVCYLSLEASYSHKRGFKLAKRLLSENNDMILWNAFAQMEKGYDKVKEAAKVYKLAIASALQAPESEPIRHDLPVLYSSYARMELTLDHPDVALGILVSMSLQEPFDDAMAKPSATQINEAKKYASKYKEDKEALARLFAGPRECDTLIHAMRCDATLAYITEGVDAAMAVFEHMIAYVRDQAHDENGYACEKIWMAYADLLYHHAVRKAGGFQPGKLRAVTQRSLDQFPSNTMLLGLFIWNEARTWIHQRVNDTLTTNLAKDPNLVLRIVNIQVHLHRQPYDHHHVRTLFESAVADSRTRSSLLLWKLYIQNELRQGERKKAKELLYRAVRRCPWSKELYMIAIEHLSHEMTNAEQLELTNLMMEKDIRTRLFIDQDAFFDTDSDLPDDDMDMAISNE